MRAGAHAREGAIPRGMADKETNARVFEKAFAHVRACAAPYDLHRKPSLLAVCFP